jgi:hypothetical protein
MNDIALAPCQHVLGKHGMMPWKSFALCNMNICGMASSSHIREGVCYVFFLKGLIYWMMYASEWREGGGTRV